MPSDNLPYLFAAYAVTWVGFFVYMFFMSRRQREMERAIQELEERENPDESLSRIND